MSHIHFASQCNSAVSVCTWAGVNPKVFMIVCYAMCSCILKGKFVLWVIPCQINTQN